MITTPEAPEQIATRLINEALGGGLEQRASIAAHRLALAGLLVDAPTDAGVAPQEPSAVVDDAADEQDDPDLHMTAPSPDREKLIADAAEYGCMQGHDCDCDQALIARLRDALAATPVGDEAALAEVIRPYDPDTPEDAAHAVAEWLRGGGR